MRKPNSDEVRPVHFIDGWWHAGDIESAALVLDSCLHKLGLQGVPTSRLEAASQAISDEEHARRHQIGIAARHANEQLAKLGRSARVRAFRQSAEWVEDTDEPVWLIVEPDEHARLLGVIGAPEEIEEAYDDPSSDRDPLAAKQPPGPKIPKHPADLFSFAKKQVDAHNYALALEALERLLALGYNTDDMVLVDLLRISTLRSLGRHADAIAAWDATATAWVAGARRVWRSQWVTLEKLHAQLKMPRGPQILAVEERKKTASA
jgi:tetratricopeptide (TPR) repeat protein